LAVILAGALGGFVRSSHLGEHWKHAIGSIAVSSITALYLSPFALPLIEIAIGKLNIATPAPPVSGFLVGLGGSSVVSIVIAAYDTLLGRTRPKGEAPPNDGDSA